ncbi:hypothetical protein N7510_008123 [Penicillium lagena]|uniref:uncharacterized protein n=1 Tax=Penicillium lagena TaxID=94218 RepID=UPI0025415E7B|nr:uncharacterized protein N7510_008123 [Penicillium lagena]KAJ5611404.1 hypothetical protein N7510_008123 [Penicillium lagena]
MTPTRYGTSTGDIGPLAQSVRFQSSGQVAKNRFMKSAMAELMATWSPHKMEERGIPTQELIELYRRWGEGKNNWGVIITGNIDIEFDALDSVGDMIITRQCPLHGERFTKFEELAAAARSDGSLILGQVSHPGRQVWDRINPFAVSASDVQLGPKAALSFGKPHAATKEEIASIVEGFAYAAEYLEKAGFNGIELHGAHGYLIAQFLSRTTNQRTDEYGPQTVENRLRFVSDIVKAIRRRVSPDFVLGVKLNSVEFQDSGVTPKEAQEVCEELERLNIDFVELSGGTYEKLGMVWERESSRKREAYFIEWAEMIIKSLDSEHKIKIYVVGGIRSVEVMVQTLNVANGVAFARPAAAEPRLPSTILQSGSTITGAIQPTAEFEKDFFTSKTLAETQMRQIADGQKPIDSSDNMAMAHFLQDVRGWSQEIANLAPTLPTSVRAVQYTGPQILYDQHFSA